MNSFGRIFKISLYGESHGSGLGVLIDSCPPGLNLSEEDFTKDILRRKSGAKGTTPRIESDQVQILNGIYEGKTTGAPLHLYFSNQNIRSKDYSKFKSQPRPGHADYTSRIKYKGYNDPNGGGQFSGRMTLPIVAAGVVAKKILNESDFEAKLIEAGGNNNIDEALDLAISQEDSIGGIVECRINSIPSGIGEPFFDSIESLISHLMFSIPAVKGIEFGSGFSATKMKGSEHNDPLIDESGKTQSNNAGGISGGLSNGNELVFRVAVKPTSSISKTQKTLNIDTGEVEDLKVTGRHDVCIALRFPVIVEAVAAIVLADLFLTNKKW